ncbi:MAG: crossover junction endodeoxyribonuclease RuvC [Planctomycetota bacterium]
MRILGIDPGLRLTGFGVVELRTGSIEPALIEGGVIKLNAKASVADRLAQLAEDLAGVIEEAKPDHLAVEQVYSHYAHPKTAIIMAHARGVILLCARQAGLTIEELAATEVKKALTGNGHASKEQMQQAVQAQFRLPEPPSPPDVADAIAIATCHARRIAVDLLDQSTKR